MAEGRSIGTIFVELDLDPSRYMKGQQKLLKDATSTSLSIEENFKKLNIKSSAEFDLMRLKASNAYEQIKNSAQATANDIVRAERAKVDKLADLNRQQFGAHTSLLSSLKANWLAATAAIAAAAGTVMKAWSMAKAGASFDEQRDMLDNLATKYKTTADTIVDEMDRASKFQIAKSELMQIALGGVAKGLNPEQLINLANAAETLGDAVGKDATTALRDLTEALETGRTRSLKTYLGTTLDLESAFGDLVSKMTAAEKAQAMYNMTMIAAIDIENRQHKAMDTAADKIATIEKRFDDATLAASRFFKRTTVGFLDFWKDFTSGKSLDELYPEDAERRARSAGQPIPRPGSDYAAPMYYGDVPKAEYVSGIQELKTQVAAREAAEKAKKKAIQDAERMDKEYKRSVEKSLEELDKMQDSFIKSDEEGLKKWNQNQTNAIAKYLEAVKKGEEDFTEQMYKWEWPTKEQTEKIVETGKVFAEEHDRWTKISLTTAQAMEQNFSTFFFDAMTGKLTSFSDFATSIFQTIQRAAADYLGGIATDLLFGATKDTGKGRSGGVLSSLFSGWGGAGAATSAGMSSEMMSMAAVMMHGGGVVGEKAPVRYVSPMIFDRALRLHRGLAHDEFPAILQEGEDVIPKGKGGGAGGALNVTINAVDAQSFAELTSRNPNAIVGPIMEALQRGGQLRNMIRGVI